MLGPGNKTQAFRPMPGSSSWVRVSSFSVGDWKQVQVVLAQIHNHLILFPLLLSYKKTPFLYRHTSPATYGIWPCDKRSSSVRISTPTAVQTFTHDEIQLFKACFSFSSDQPANTLQANLPKEPRADQHTRAVQWRNQQHENTRLKDDIVLSTSLFPSGPSSLALCPPAFLST